MVLLSVQNFYYRERTLTELDFHLGKGGLTQPVWDGLLLDLTRFRIRNTNVVLLRSFQERKYHSHGAQQNTLLVRPLTEDITQSPERAPDDALKLSRRETPCVKSRPRRQQQLTLPRVTVWDMSRSVGVEDRKPVL